VLVGCGGDDPFVLDGVAGGGNVRDGGVVLNRLQEEAYAILALVCNVESGILFTSRAWRNNNC